MRLAFIICERLSRCRRWCCFASLTLWLSLSFLPRMVGSFYQVRTVHRCTQQWSSKSSHSVYFTMLKDYSQHATEPEDEAHGNNIGFSNQRW